jgi:PKD repeat protein
MVASPAVAGLAVTFVDKSTDAEDPQRKLKIAVNWGDGTIETGFVGTTFMHTYLETGSYTIAHRVTDSGGLTAYEYVSVAVVGP